MQEKKVNMRKLIEFLDKNNLSQAQFAKIIGTSNYTLSNIIRNLRRPTLELAYSIEKNTFGKVKMKDWLLIAYSCHDKADDSHDENKTTKKKYAKL